MRGEWVRKPTGSVSVVFVHGILSSGETCWRNDNGADWPQLLKSEPGLEALGIYVYSYETGIFSGTYSLNDVVDDLKERLLTLDKVADGRRIVFVCHSMGGIVVRKFLVERVSDLLDRNLEIGLFLVASPSLGAAYANWLAPIAKLMGHSQADALRFTQGNAWLNGLDREFQNLKESGRLTMQGKELVEDKFVILQRFWRKQVVEPFVGARYFGEPYKVPGSDHFSIAKPENADAVQHRLLIAFIEKLGCATAPATDSRESRPSGNRTPQLETSGQNAASPLPAVFMLPPSGPLPPDHPAYIRREADERIDDEPMDYGETFTVKAAEQMGKTSLLLRYLARCEAAGKKTALIDFLPFSDQELAGLSGFLSCLSRELLGQFGCDPSLARPIESCHGFTRFVGDVILANIDAPIVLAFDNVDRLIDQDYRDSFFYSLRDWSTERTRESSKGAPEKRWRRLSLILTIATEPTLLIKTADMSPFNVTDPMRLQSFTLGDIGRLNQIHGHPLDEAGVRDLFDLLGGHPSLTQWAYYRLTGPRPMSIGTLTARAVADDGPFAEHLRARHKRLIQHPNLATVFRDLLRFNTQPEQSNFYRLQALGLVRRDDSDRVVPANRLYTRFFERVLA